MPQSSFPAKAMAEFGKQVPLKRPGQPKEVAAAFGACTAIACLKSSSQESP